MIDVKKLWRKRRNAHLTQMLKYFSLMANSGLIVSLYLLIIVGSIYYAKLLKALPENFPAVLLLTVLFSLLLTKSAIRTLIKEGDLVFLLPVESGMKHYFSKSLSSAIASGSFVTLLIFTLTWPIVQVFITDGWEMYVSFAFFLIVAKAFNLYVGWEERRLPYKSHQLNYKIMRYIVNFVYVYLLFEEAYVFLIAMFAIMYVLKNFVFGVFKKMHGYQWEMLLEEEQTLKMKGYRFVNYFTDVPALKQTVHKRPFLNMLGNFSFKKKNRMSALFMKTFIRSGDYLGLYIRLIVIGFFFLYLIPPGWWQLAVVLLFFQMLSLQLFTLYTQYSWNVIFNLYPIEPRVKISAFMKWLRGLLLLQGLMYGVFYGILTGDWLIGLLMPAAAFGYSMLRLPVLTKKHLPQTS
ncbi:ABC transporter permease [Fictibacillus phosphorivorans]|uniref:ABC transporter permease n=1 Tax=Fictibacillus phosphorivorans TaxID=1221500 RepID=UPI00203F2AE9|nr:ABC transporter permease [Fictibacillus phosphorivorans]MCM3717488.1 ABC transporter permease [Fictibacillus phosphorivorans]MCM3775183.1 ABC transporter permease [Fictibacillus phosphorivorans]